jgi:hypothetical protein
LLNHDVVSRSNEQLKAAVSSVMKSMNKRHHF